MLDWGCNSPPSQFEILSGQSHTFVFPEMNFVVIQTWNPSSHTTPILGDSIYFFLLFSFLILDIQFFSHWLVPPNMSNNVRACHNTITTIFPCSVHTWLFFKILCLSILVSFYRGGVSRDTNHQNSESNIIIEDLDQTFHGNVSKVQASNIDLTKPYASGSMLLDGIRKMVNHFSPQQSFSCFRASFLLS